MIAETIACLRTAKGVSQSQAAKAIGITRNGWNSYEQGLSLPNIANLVEIAKYFNVSTDYLLGLNDETNIRTDGLDPDEIALIVALIGKLRAKK